MASNSKHKLALRRVCAFASARDKHKATATGWLEPGSGPYFADESGFVMPPLNMVILENWWQAMDILMQSNGTAH